MVANAFNTSTRMSEFKASLVYIVSKIKGLGSENLVGL